MAPKELHFNTEARAALKRGVDQLAEAVKVTLGPKGRNVVIDKKFGAPTVTKDGVTVAPRHSGSRSRAATPSTTTRSSRPTALSSRACST